MNTLKGNTATLGTSNSTSISIVINESGDGVLYQFGGYNDDKIYNAEIVYKEDVDDMLGYNTPEELFPAFYIYKRLYFIGEFCRDNMGQQGET